MKGLQLSAFMFISLTFCAEIPLPPVPQTQTLTMEPPVAETERQLLQKAEKGIEKKDKSLRRAASKSVGNPQGVPTKPRRLAKVGDILGAVTGLLMGGPIGYFGTSFLNNFSEWKMKEKMLEEKLLDQVSELETAKNANHVDVRELRKVVETSEEEMESLKDTLSRRVEELRAQVLRKIREGKGIKLV